MRVRALGRFRDLERGTLREAGDVFEVTEGRYKALNASKYGVLVEKVETPEDGGNAPQEGSQAPTEASGGTQRKRTTTRKRTTKQE